MSCATSGWCRNTSMNIPAGECECCPGPCDQPDPDEQDVEPDLFCPVCNSCGIGGCCNYYCDACKDRHDDPSEARHVPPGETHKMTHAYVAARFAVGNTRADDEEQ